MMGVAVFGATDTADEMVGHFRHWQPLRHRDRADIEVPGGLAGRAFDVEEFPIPGEIPEITTPNGGRPAATSRARARNPATRKYIHTRYRTGYEVDSPIRPCSPSHVYNPNLGGPICLVANILLDIPRLLDVPSFRLDTGLHRECSRICRCR
jgi:hypothetical protein